jgi:hypothetical protein
LKIIFEQWAFCTTYTWNIKCCSDFQCNQIENDSNILYPLFELENKLFQYKWKFTGAREVNKLLPELGLHLSRPAKYSWGTLNLSTFLYFISKQFKFNSASSALVSNNFILIFHSWYHKQTQSYLSCAGFNVTKLTYQTYKFINSFQVLTFIFVILFLHQT